MQISSGPNGPRAFFSFPLFAKGFSPSCFNQRLISPYFASLSVRLLDTP
jgi:hypothetical protein